MWFFHLRKMQEGPSPFFVSRHLSYMKFNKLDLPVIQLPKNADMPEDPQSRSQNQRKSSTDGLSPANVTKALPLPQPGVMTFLKKKKNDGDARKMQKHDLKATITKCLT